jgi:hypothetical protein
MSCKEKTRIYIGINQYTDFNDEICQNLHVNQMIPLNIKSTFSRSPMSNWSSCKSSAVPDDGLKVSEQAKLDLYYCTISLLTLLNR